MKSTMNGGYGETELINYELPERDFAGAQWGEVIGWLRE
jgi:hypothetical protein